MWLVQKGKAESPVNAFAGLCSDIEALLVALRRCKTPVNDKPKRLLSCCQLFCLVSLSIGINMEALVALGLASNVVQFVDFVSKIFVTATEIAGSAQGATQGNVELEKVYSRLLTFSALLQPPETHSSSNNDARGLHGFLVSTAAVDNHVGIQYHASALEQLAFDCNALCKELLRTLERLRSGSTFSRYIQFCIATFRTVWSQKKIAKLEERVKRFQNLISLHFLPLLRFVNLIL
jgi:hypothetical protein